MYLISFIFSVEFADIEDTLSANNLSREEAQYIVRVALDTVTKELKEIYPIIKKVSRKKKLILLFSTLIITV